MEQVLGSLKLSMLTGPNEGYVMAERGIFGVSLWESLSPDLKRRVINDLAKGGNETEISDHSFHATREGAERATRGPPRYWAFAERDRATTGILASGGLVQPSALRVPI